MGEEFPVETATSRSLRRTVRLAASQMPALKPIEDELDRAAAEMSEILKEARALQGGEVQPALGPTPLRVPEPGEYGSSEAAPPGAPASVSSAVSGPELTREESLAFDRDLVARESDGRL